MALVQTSIDFSEFKNAFIAYKREDNFSQQGLRLLYDYFEDFEENVEFDVLAICCDYCESSIDTIIQDYNVDVGDSAFLSDMKSSPEIRRDVVREYLQDNTCIVGETAQGFVFASF